MASENQRRLCYRAFRKWGESSQLIIAMEECGELLVAISHFLRERPDATANLAGEIADVELVCTSLRLLVGDDAVDDAKREKWARLESRLDAEDGLGCMSVPGKTLEET